MVKIPLIWKRPDSPVWGKYSYFLLLSSHVELSSNEATSYRSRELKSVHIDAYGSCFQIFLYKNYSNVENPFNQISIIALNFIGEVELSKLDPLALGNNVAK